MKLFIHRKTQVDNIFGANTTLILIVPVERLAVSQKTN